MKPEFRCGYRGESDFTYKGKRYSVRSGAFPGDGATATSADGHYNGDYYFKGILPAVGTIRNDDCAGFHEFPSPEVCAFFPDYVPARWNEDFSAIEYQGDKPEVIALSYGVVARKIAERDAMAS